MSYFGNIPSSVPLTEEQISSVGDPRYVNTSGDTFTGPIVLPAGNTSVTSLSIGSNTNTGFYQPTASQIGIVTGGSERVRVDSSGNVGIGKTPTTKLDVDGTVNASAFTGDGSALTGIVATPSGAVMAYAGATVPSGWLECTGAAVSRTTYANLFAAIGTTYGAGDGSTTFNLPNLRDRTVFGSGSSYALGTTGGAETVTLTEAQIPSHTHSFSGSGSTSTDGWHAHTGSTTSAGSHAHSMTTGSGNTNQPGTQYNSLALTYHQSYVAATNPTTTAGSHSHSLSINGNGSHSHTVTVSGTTGATGSGSAHNNMPPYLAMLWIIKT